MTTSDAPHLRIVILNYNTRDLLRDCLQSLLGDAESARWHVVVVDNASKDGSAEMVAEEFPGVTLIASDKNAGFSAGNNVGCEGATEPVLLFLNPDTIIPAGAIEPLRRFVEQTPECVAAGPRLLNADGSVQLSCRTFPGPLNTLLEGFWLNRLFPKSRFFGRPTMSWLDHTQTVPVDYVAGAALLVAREDFERVGGWPEAYFFYAEDADLCRSLAADGRRVYLFGETAITHIGGASASQLKLSTTLEAQRSVMLFAHRTGGPRRLTLQRIATVAVTVPRSLGAALLLPLAGLVGRGPQVLHAQAIYMGTLFAVFSRVAAPRGK